jgi:hypothetical protein
MTNYYKIWNNYVIYRRIDSYSLIRHKFIVLRLTKIILMGRQILKKWKNILAQNCDEMENCYVQTSNKQTKIKQISFLLIYHKPVD